MDLDQIKEFLRFLILANESIDLVPREEDYSVIDETRPVLEMYKQNIKEYESKIKYAKTKEEKALFTKLLDTLRDDVKKFSVTEAHEQ